jgi:Fe-S-cluster formation regulator IscX/YfhJ
MKKSEYLKRYRLVKLDDSTVSIDNKFFSFSYTRADHIVKDEFKGMYRYLGGLQCEHEPETQEYKDLESWLCELAEKVLGIDKRAGNQDGVEVNTTKGGRFSVYSNGVGKFQYTVKALEENGYKEVPNDNGGDDDYICVDHVNMEYIWCENGTWPFSISSLESFEDDKNSSLAEFHRVRR